MRTHIDENTRVDMPKNLLKSCTLVAEKTDGSCETLMICENHKALRYIQLPENTIRVTLRQLCSWGGECVGIFSCDTI